MLRNDQINNLGLQKEGSSPKHSKLMWALGDLGMSTYIHRFAWLLLKHMLKAF